MRFASFSPDSHRIVTATVNGYWYGEFNSVQNCEARVWDAATGKPITPPMIHSGAVNSAVFSPDGRRNRYCKLG